MNDHGLFLEAYENIQDEKECQGFLRGYLFALSPEEMMGFLLKNFEAGLMAYEQTLTAGTMEEKSDAKKELEQMFGLLKNRTGTVS